MLSRRIAICGIVIGGLLAGCKAPVSVHEDAAIAENGAVYYLVRHTEKEADTSDPPLNAAGLKRAEDLKTRLSKVPLSAIYSSDYKRTRDTAAPVANDKSLDVIIYDPRDLDGLSNILSAQNGVILVVGHSNTTPQLAKLLGGEPGEPIVEKTEYDRLYRVVRNGVAVSSTIERYGD